MAANLIEREIRACIDSFVDDLSALVNTAAIEAVQEALGGGAGRRRRGPGRPRKTASKPGKRIRRSSDDLEASAARILSHIKANPSSGVTEIAAALRKTSKDLRLPIQKLLEEKKLRTTGQRRGTKYHVTGQGGSPDTVSIGKKPRRSKAKAKRKKTKGSRKAA